MTHTSPRSIRSAFVALAAVACLLPATAGVRAQNSDLKAERVVDFATDRPIAVGARVGPVQVQTVEFSDRGRSSASFGTLVKNGSISETSTVLRTHILAENATANEWDVTFTFEFLDRAGKLIDRATKKSSWEGQSKPTDLDHPILQYAIPLIAQVRITMEAKLD